jgi:MFS family permease
VTTFDQPSHSPERRIASSPYVPWCIVAAAYTLAFFQRVAPQAFVDRLMADFSLDAAGLAALLSCYFYGYLITQVPAGVIVDRWGVRLPVIVTSWCQSPRPSFLRTHPRSTNLQLRDLLVAQAMPSSLVP